MCEMVWKILKKGYEWSLRDAISYGNIFYLYSSNNFSITKKNVSCLGSENSRPISER